MDIRWMCVYPAPSKLGSGAPWVFSHSASQYSWPKDFVIKMFHHQESWFIHFYKRIVNITGSLIRIYFRWQLVMTHTDRQIWACTRMQRERARVSIMAQTDQWERGIHKRSDGQETQGRTRTTNTKADNGHGIGQESIVNYHDHDHDLILSYILPRLQAN